MNTKNNRRAQETRQRIQTALTEMLKEQELDQISVSQLCKRADVNRSTFYAHYDDVLSLMEEIEIGIWQDVMDALQPHIASGKAWMPKQYLVAILEQIRANQSFYRAYLHSLHGQRRVERGFSQMLDGFVRPYMHRMGLTDDVQVDYYFIFFKEGMLALIRRWVDRGCPELPEVIAEIIGNMASHPEIDFDGLRD